MDSSYDLTHASFFSGVGGLDMGLERAGWRTVSFSEIDPYASAVLAERWPGVPNLGDITRLAAARGDLNGGIRSGDGDADSGRVPTARPTDDAGGQAGGRQGTAAGDRREPDAGHQPYADAVLWTGGFPCQDLSVAGKRRGMGVDGARTRSGLAYAFLDLVRVHRPPLILLENVPGLLSSHGGRDMAALLGALVELGYGVGYRVLDARYFGVPQRRRRVLIVGVTPGGRAGALRAAEVLSVGSRCRRHPPTGVEAGPDAAAGARPGVDIVGTVPAGLGHHGHAGTSSQAVAAGHVIAEGVSRPVIGSYKRSDDDISTLIPTLTDPNRLRWDAGYAVEQSPALTTRQERNNHPGDQSYVVGSSPDPGGVRAPDGLAGRVDDRGVAATLNSGGNDGGFRTEPGEHLVAASLRASDGHHGHGSPRGDGGDNLVTEVPIYDVDGSVASMLPLGLDSHRYRCCGNGVVAPVAEWIGHRLAEALA